VQVLGQVLQTLAALHEAGFAHRNIKPSNILQREQQHDWMLFDFSASCPVGAALFSTLDVFAFTCSDMSMVLVPWITQSFLLLLHCAAPSLLSCGYLAVLITQ
jgi:serine/threonine protein kinase